MLSGDAYRDPNDGFPVGAQVVVAVYDVENGGIAARVLCDVIGEGCERMLVGIIARDTGEKISGQSFLQYGQFVRVLEILEGDLSPTILGSMFHAQLGLMRPIT